MARNRLEISEKEDRPKTTKEMRLVIQRVKRAGVKIKGQEVGQIEKGLLIFLGIGQNDTEKEVEFLVKKVLNLRIFADEEDKMNLSLLDIKGEVLVVPQFTLYGNCQKGNRPSFIKAALPERAQRLYEEFVQEIKESGLKIATGKFGAMMQVELINDGPVTLILETKNSKKDR